MESPEWDTVTGQTWTYHFPHILQDISECTFVALDFEFSGIPTYQGSRRQTLQERYAEVKEAAGTYQILQVGLAIVKEDAIAAVQFLLKSGFDLNAPFQEGVHYLSTKEEKKVLEDAHQHNSGRSETGTTAQMVLSKRDRESVAFLADVRKDIEAWLSVGEGRREYLNVPSRDATSRNGRPATTSLNRFQKRLVHQLVETEYPSLTSIGCPDYIRIVKYDKEREDRIRREKLNRVEKRLLELRGFRWVIEALTGGDLSQLTPQAFHPLVGVVEEEEDAAAYWKRTIDALKSKNGRIPLVGHNLFMDVVYLWQCFYGYLPDQVEEFARLLHEKFPMLIDTKYIFTHDCGDMNPVASLDDIAKACNHITKPEIIINSKHTRYQNKTCPHEAGYDSLLTAQNFIKQAVQLPGARPRASPLPSIDTLIQHTKPVSIQPGGVHTATANTTSTKHTDDKNRSTTNSGTKFAGRNLYGALESISLEPTGPESVDTLTMANSGPELIPSFSAPVWKVYGNKLRVFGTQERVFKLDSIRR
uniref:Uncharacterized protein C29A10.09c n=1 Tax=Talaromyces marneffei PM1 TaxID=1077442 RepID=A0A093Y1F0_TALMA